MTISHSRFLKSRGTNATLNGETIEIFHQTPIHRSDKAWRKAEASFAATPKVIKYGICSWVDTPKDKIGARVVKLPDDFNGVTTELMDSDLETVGTLLKRGRQYVVETNEEAIEIIRRQMEKESMDAGRRSVGKFGYDSDAYLADMNARDTPENMFTRGHGLG